MRDREFENSSIVGSLSVPLTSPSSDLSGDYQESEKAKKEKKSTDCCWCSRLSYQRALIRLEQMGNCAEERFKTVVDYPTSFGTLVYNAACIIVNIAQILCLCIVLGAYKSDASLTYIWWPFIEALRLFILTMARVDVVLKDFSELANQRRSFEKTRNLILACNMVGFISFVICGPLYLVCLPSSQRNTGLHESWFWIYPTFILLRLVLSAPIITALVTGSPLQRLYVGGNYERISDNAANMARQRSSDSGSQNNFADMHDGFYEEQRILAAVAEESKREAERNLRLSQEQEYEEELRREAARLSTANDYGIDRYAMDPSSCDTGLASEPATSVISGMVIPQTLVSPSKNDSDEAILVDESNNKVNSQIVVDIPELEAMVEEPVQSNSTVRIVVQHRSATLSRRFDQSAKMSEVYLWMNHEMIDAGKPELVNSFSLCSRFPSKSYESSNSQSMKELGFWNERSTPTSREQQMRLFLDEY